MRKAVINDMLSGDVTDAIIVVLALLAIAWILLYDAYWAHDYAGNPARPPHYAIVSEIFVVGVSVLFTALYAVLLPSPDQFSLANVVGVGLTLLTLENFGVVSDLAYQKWRRYRRSRRRGAE